MPKKEKTKQPITYPTVSASPAQAEPDAPFYSFASAAQHIEAIELLCADKPQFIELLADKKRFFSFLPKLESRSAPADSMFYQVINSGAFIDFMSQAVKHFLSLGKKQSSENSSQLINFFVPINIENFNDEQTLKCYKAIYSDVLETFDYSVSNCFSHTIHIQVMAYHFLAKRNYKTLGTLFPLEVCVQQFRNVRDVSKDQKALFSLLLGLVELYTMDIPKIDEYVSTIFNAAMEIFDEDFTLQFLRKQNKSESSSGSIKVALDKIQTMATQRVEIHRVKSRLEEGLGTNSEKLSSSLINKI